MSSSHRALFDDDEVFESPSKRPCPPGGGDILASMRREAQVLQGNIQMLEGLRRRECERSQEVEELQRDLASERRRFQQACAEASQNLAHERRFASEASEAFNTREAQLKDLLGRSVTSSDSNIASLVAEVVRLEEELAEVVEDARAKCERARHQAEMVTRASEECHLCREDFASNGLVDRVQLLCCCSTACPALCVQCAVYLMHGTVNDTTGYLNENTVSPRLACVLRHQPQVCVCSAVCFCIGSGVEWTESMRVVLCCVFDRR